VADVEADVQMLESLLAQVSTTALARQVLDANKTRETTFLLEKTRQHRDANEGRLVQCRNGTGRQRG
jgi:hypothetical protein